MYELYGSSKTRAFRPIWMFEELGVDYTHHPSIPHAKELRDLTPSGKVPVLVVDGTTVPDSAAILTYLADHHGALTYKAGTTERAVQDSITHQILDDLDSVLWTTARHTFVLPEDKRVRDVKPSLAWEYDRNINRMADRLEGPWLMGDQFTTADILLTHCMRWAQSAKFAAGPDKLADYYARATSRPAYLAAMEKG